MIVKGKKKFLFIQNPYEKFSLRDSNGKRILLLEESNFPGGCAYTYLFNIKKKERKYKILFGIFLVMYFCFFFTLPS